MGTIQEEINPVLLSQGLDDMYAKEGLEYVAYENLRAARENKEAAEGVLEEVSEKEPALEEEYYIAKYEKERATNNAELNRDTTLSWNRRELLKKPSILWTATWKAFKMPMILPREKEKSRHNSSRMKLTTMFQNTTQQRMVLQNSQKNLKNLKLLRDNEQICFGQ